MKFPELVLSLVRTQLDENPTFLGVRLSPVRLTAGEARELARLAPEALGERIYVAVSAPGTKYQLSGRVLVAPDERAAEKATEWRNVAHPNQGEHLVYVSVDVHGRAGGLQDCLHPLSEKMLREHFGVLCDDTERGFPVGLGETLSEARLIERVSSHQLCEFADAVAQRTHAGATSWAAVGAALGDLYLATDTRLRAADARDRLRANTELVARVLTGERQGSRKAQNAEATALMSKLRAAAESSSTLRSVDVGEIQTAPLLKLAGLRPTSKRGRGKPKPTQGKRKKKANKKKTKRKKEATTKPVTPTEDLRPVDEEFVNDLLDKKPESREKEARRRARRLVGNAGVWDDKVQRSELGSIKLPAGLLEAFALLEESGHDGISLQVRGDVRRSIQRIPASHELVGHDLKVSSLTREIENWRCARLALMSELDEVTQKRSGAALELLLRAPLLALADEHIGGHISTLIDRGADLLTKAEACSDPAELRAALNIDTITIRSRAGEEALIVSPLHPLWLAQSKARYESLLREAQLDDTARRLVARSLAAAPVAPPRWPSPSGVWLDRSSVSMTLPTYDVHSEAVPLASVRTATRLLAKRLLELEPYAHLGLRVRAEGRGAAGVVDGMADLLHSIPALSGVSVHVPEALAEYSAAASQEIAEGRLSVLPASNTTDTLQRPHIRVLADPTTPGPEDEEPAPPETAGHAGGVGFLPTRFELRGGTLRVETPVTGHPALEAIEALLSRLDDRHPRKVFVHSAKAASLGTLLKSRERRGVTWDVLLAPRISGCRPEGAHDLVRERVGTRCEVSAITDVIDPASRWLAAGLNRLGVADLRPRTLRALAERLGDAGAGGLVSLTGPGDHLLAAGTLGLALRDRGQEPMLVAPITGSSYRTLLGREPESDDSVAFALGLSRTGEELSIEVGFAAVADASLSAKSGGISGDHGIALNRLVTVITHALNSDSLSGVVAREELAWVLWPAVASDPRHAELSELVRSLGAGAKASVSALLLLPPEHRVVRKRVDLSIASTKAEVIALSVESLEQLLLA